MTFRPTFTTPSRYRYLVAVLATWLAALSSGCQGYRPNLTQNGSLKAGYSQVQFENETLKAKLAKLEKQNRMLVADLQREESLAVASGSFV